MQCGKSGNKNTLSKTKDNHSILKIDLDSKLFSRFMTKFLTRYRKAKYAFDFKIQDIKVFETKKGYHIELYLDKRIFPYEVIFYQLFFCSDYMREILNLRRLRFRRTTIDQWNILHEAKYNKSDKKFIWRKQCKILEQRILKEMNIINDMED